MRERDYRSAVERLKRRSDFKAAAQGARVSARAFALQGRRRTEGGAARVGFTVSRQVGNAVERNLVRRRLREIVRLSIAAGGGPMRPGHDYVLVGRRAALAAPFAEMIQDLAAALGRLHARAAESAGGAAPAPLHEAGSPSRRQTPRRRRASKPSTVPPRKR